MHIKTSSYLGLSDGQVLESRVKSGSNTIDSKKQYLFAHVIKNVVTEPMFILLIATSITYFLLRQYQEGMIMLFALFAVSGISFFQEYRSSNAIKELNKIISSRATVVRNGREIKIDPAEVVVGDIMLLQEGEIVAADALIREANDLSVNESVLSGESFSVMKSADLPDCVYMGTMITSGFAVGEVTAVGNLTRIGQLGKSLKAIPAEKTPLQQQIRKFLARMVWAGSAAFVIVVIVKFIHSRDYIMSLLQGLTMAMSILPEEIPVAFSTFLALGAYRLSKSNIIVRHPHYVETLGSATNICIDKTGTITENAMKIAYVYDALNKKNIHIPSKSSLPAELIEYAMWSSETHPFDPMEIAIHELYQQTAKSDKRLLATQEHEYPLSGQPPMMTHIFKLSDGSTIIASKGAPEAIFRHCDVSRHDYELLNSETLKYAAQGFRVLAVAKAKSNGAYPSSQQDFQLNILGLIAFYDPPKKNITSILRAFYEAGISVKIITGDYSQTVLAIAKAINLKNSGLFLTGDDIAAMPEDVLRQKVKEINIYARMYPESKLKVINALKANGEVVAMTGDGVNDALALKAAHIGIAMGRRGNEVAKNASSLILTDDDLAHMVQAIGLGRKIYDNLKKAIQYIISIHIPIILIVTLPLLLSWKFSGIFTPMHVIFFELIMGPTCSVIYENEPQEPDAMYRPPRKPSYTFFSSRQLMISILQGVVITVGCLGIGLYFMNRGCTETMVRASIFITLIFCNILLTFENRSFHHSVFKTWAYKNDLLYAITGLTALLVPLLLIVPFFRKSFQLTHLSVSALATCFTVAIASTLWIELLKYFKRGKRDA